MQQQLKNAAVPAGAGSAEKTEAMADADLIDVRLEAVRFATHDINLYELRALDREALPAFTAGAHIDVHFPNDIVPQN
jgi:NAD(P)H-flavin reductase